MASFEFGGLEEMVEKTKISEDYKNSEEYRAVKYLREKGINPKEVINLSKALISGDPYKDHKPKSIGKNHVKYLAISDTHIGNTNYDPHLMDLACREAKKQKCDFAIHAGDVVDGWYQNRPTQLFELNAVGVDQQVNMAVKELSKLPVPLYFITANHEYNTFMRGAGVEIGHILQERLTEKGKKVYFLGNAEGDIKLKSGTTIKLLHPDGGSSYAISYKTQKIIEAMEGGKKPQVLHIGNFHKAEYLFYRNVHAFQAATLENQTKFMKGLSLSAHKGFYIIDLWTNNRGEVSKICPTFYPSYD